MSKKLKNVLYFRNQIGKRVVFTEDGDNPYYKQASPGITDYFPSVQDKQKTHKQTKFLVYGTHP